MLANYINIFLFIFSFITYFSYLYTKGGSTLLKSRDGGRSLNISIEKYALHSYSLIMIKEDYGILEGTIMIKITNHIDISRIVTTR